MALLTTFRTLLFWADFVLLRFKMKDVSGFFPNSKAG